MSNCWNTAVPRAAKAAVGVFLLLVGVALPYQALARSGGFMGVQAGWSSNDAEVAEGFQFGADYLEARIDGISADGMAGGAFLGYGWQGINGFFAVEANLGVSSADADIKVTASSGSDTVSLEAGVNHGLGVLMGMHAEGATPYLRLGWQVARYEMQSDKQTHDGFRYGLGALIPLRDRLDLRMEWTQTRFGSESYFDDTVEIEPTESLFSVGISSRF